jgi:sugar phosphate isomerase/epimerase
MKKVSLGFIQGRMILPPRKSVLQYFPKKFWKKEFFYAGKHGFKFIEYIGERVRNNANPIWKKSGLDKIKILTKKNRLINYSFCDDFFIKKEFVVYEKFNEYFNDLSKNLSYLKIKIYVLALFEKSNITRKNYRHFINRIRNLSDLLRSVKIKLAIETNISSELFIKMLKLINRKNFFLVYDTGNRLKKNNKQFAEILKLKKFICHIHLKDKNFSGDNVILGQGNVDFDLIFDALKKINYRGKYTFETNRGSNPVNTMIKNKALILKKLNQKI